MRPAFRCAEAITEIWLLKSLSESLPKAGLVAGVGFVADASNRPRIVSASLLRLANAVVFKLRSGYRKVVGRRGAS